MSRDHGFLWLRWHHGAMHQVKYPAGPAYSEKIILFSISLYRRCFVVVVVVVLASATIRFDLI